jgi:streptomycin 6-kinase
LSLDIPDQVRKTVIAGGNESWLDELPGVVGSLAREWSLMIGSSFAGGHAALVVEVTLADGTPADLKIGVPGRDAGPEAMVLRLADGGACARLLGEDVSRQALLPERLGAPVYDVVAGPVRRHDLLCEARFACGVRSVPALTFRPARGWLSSTPVCCHGYGSRGGGRVRRPRWRTRWIA